MAMLIAACGSGPTSPNNSGPHSKAPANRQVLVSGAEAGISDLKTLDPGILTDAHSNYVVEDIFTGLVTLDDH